MRDYGRRESILKVLSTYCVGKENAMRSKDIAEACGTAPEYVRRIVSEERKNGMPILTSVGRGDTERKVGFYISHDKREIARYASSLEERAKDIMRAVNGLRKYVNDGLDKE